MTLPPGPAPPTLYDALNLNYWNGGTRNERTSTPLPTIQSTMIRMLGQNNVSKL